LVESGFIDQTENGFEVHDWALEHKRFIIENKKARGNKPSQGTDALVPRDESKKVRSSLVRIEENRIEENRKTKPLSGASAPGFEEFWQAYPKRTGKGACAKIWAKKKPPLDTCLATLAWQKKSEQWTKEGGQFIPLPATWLNQDRWLDEKESGRGRGTGDGYSPRNNEPYEF
jgi:hypothetical protein